MSYYVENIFLQFQEVYIIIVSSRMHHLKIRIKETNYLKIFNQIIQFPKKLV